jgi:hypothetical protein
VFKIADIVHIHSYPYSFKFDTTKDSNHRELGMIEPSWEEPSDTDAPSAQTRILIELKLGIEAADMESDMDSVRPDILLFLRKIKSMETQSLKGSRRLFSMRERDGISNVIIRIKEYEGTTSNPPRKSLNHYHVSRRTVEKLPKDDRRPKIASTEIVLAFPLVD